MKSEIERRRHRRAVNTLGRLVFTRLGPLTLSLLFAAYSPPAHADTITVFGTPGTPGVDGPVGLTAGQAETRRRQRHRIATRVTLRTRQAESGVMAVTVPIPALQVVTEELAAMPLR